MASLNKVQLIGNLGKDPEVRYTQGGTAVASFSMATSEKWKDKNSGEMRERTEWHNIVAWGRLAEVCGEYLHKGKQVYIEGQLKTEKYEKDGVTRYATKITAQSMKMLGSNPQGQQPGAQGGGYGNGGYPGPGNSAAPPEYDGPPPGGYDDDIPF